MPYVNIQVTREGVTAEQKARLINIGTKNRLAILWEQTRRKL